jgi:hypothetical protein
MNQKTLVTTAVLVALMATAVVTLVRNNRRGRNQLRRRDKFAKHDVS